MIEGDLPGEAGRMQGIHRNQRAAVETGMTHGFDSIADAYDSWYETPEGAVIFEAEVSCLRLVCPQCRGRWLEVGVGTGRFASALGAGEGIDPSGRMLAIAARRGVKTHVGHAERLPFADARFDGALLVLALCFLADPAAALRECCRVLLPNGRLLLGVIPADSPWGKEYAEKAAKGHPVYALARFRTTAEIVRLAEGAGFTLVDSASTLFWKPGETPELKPQTETGVSPGAGFVALLFAKTAPRGRPSQ